MTSLGRKIDPKTVDKYMSALRDSLIIYYQVAATVRDESTLKRELASLQKIKDNYPKFNLTLDDDPEADYILGLTFTTSGPQKIK